MCGDRGSLLLGALAHEGSVELGERVVPLAILPEDSSTVLASGVLLPVVRLRLVPVGPLDLVSLEVNPHVLLLQIVGSNPQLIRERGFVRNLECFLRIVSLISL